MAENWRSGDLAICVRGGRIDPGHSGPFPRSGAVYRVLDSYVYGLRGVWLLLDGAPDNHDLDGTNRGPQWHSRRFRKIHPLSIEEHNAEIRLLTGKPVKEPVT